MKKVPKKKKSVKIEFESKYAYIAVIVVCVIIGGKIIFSDAKETLKDTDTGSVITEFTGAGDLINSFKKVSESGAKAAGELQSNGFKEQDRYEATFVKAKDGDTFVVKSENGSTQTIRLIGVDTPESVAPASYSKENTQEGKEVSDIIKDKLHEGDKVYLEFDVTAEDKYNRILAYVYFDNGTMVQDWLLSNGYARTMTVPPNVKYADHFKEIQHIAAENKVGLWNGFFESEGETTSSEKESK